MKNGENEFWGTPPPPPQKINNLGGVQKFVVQNEKNQSCSKLPEMARKLVVTSFGLFIPPHQKK